MRKPGRRCRSTKAGNKENKNLVGQITIGDSRVRIPSAVTQVSNAIAQRPGKGLALGRAHPQGRPGLRFIHSMAAL